MLPHFSRPRSLPLLILTLVAAAAPAWAESAPEAVSPTDAPSARLDGVTVTGTRAPYAVTDAATGTKTDTPLIETPQSITVITQEQMRDQGAQSVQDTLRYTAGVYADAYGPDSRGDFSLIRGTDYLQYLDGTRQQYGYNNLVRPDPYQLERIDVLKGPASVLYGQSTAGGIVNLVSKQPLTKTQGEFAAQYGSFNRRQLQADATGPLDAGKEWLYRVVAVGRESGTQVDHVDDDRLLLVPSLSWRPSADTRLTVRGTLQRDATGSSTAFLPHSGTIFYNPNGELPTSRFVSEPGFDKYDSNQTALAYEFEQRFGERFAFRQNFRYVRALTDYQSMYPDDFSNPDNPYIDADRRVVNRYVYISKQRSRAFTLDNQLQAAFGTGVLSHTVLLGFDASRFTQTGLSGTAFTTPLDLYAPVYGQYTLPATAETPKSTQTQYGFYAQDQIRFGGGWIALGSLRHDLADSETDGVGGAAGSKQNDDATTFRLGLLYHARNGLAPYASYAQSFNPVVGLNADNQPFKPLRGQQIETGVKFQPEGRQSFVTAAVYEIREKNRVTYDYSDANNPFRQVQLGEGRSRGFEIEGTGHLTRRLDLIGSYTYTAAVVSKSNNADEVGKRIASIPRQQASLWAHYGFSLFEMGGFEAGGGVRYVGDSYDGNNALRTPSVTLLDALLGYERGAWRLSLNASNLLDETYETTCLSRGDCFYGARRSVVGSIGWRW